jgi:hypothetical protein
MPVRVPTLAGVGGKADSPKKERPQKFFQEFTENRGGSQNNPLPLWAGIRAKELKLQEARKPRKSGALFDPAMVGASGLEPGTR